MLQELRIKNFAIIREQEIEFSDGLNVISGETGSGKSLIMHALDFALGGKLGTGFVRAGAKQLEVEALFDISDLPEEIRRELPDFLDSGEFVVARTATDSGRGKIYLNGHLATTSLLQQVSRTLVTICSQAEHVQLLDPPVHRRLLDDFAHLSSELLSYQGLYLRWRELTTQFDQMTAELQKAELKREDLTEQLAEFVEVGLVEGLREDLEQTIARLKNGERLRAETDEFLDLLLHEKGLLSLVQRLRSSAHSLAQLDSSLASLEEHVSTAESYLETCEQDLTRYVSSLEGDDGVLEKARERLAKIARLERKYRVVGNQLVDVEQRLRSELENIPTPERLDEIAAEKDLLTTAVRKAAAALRLKRERAARTLEKSVEQELEELSMFGAQVAVQLRDCEPGKWGTEEVEFMLRSNPGEPAKPLRKIASGGELSRLTLVLKKLLRDTARVNVLVFDEVDTGISGSVARAVGTKLRALAENSQVICVSHLPQVASLAARNLFVEKVGTTRVESKIRLLEGEERVQEIARMLAGFEVTEAARESARELLSSNS